MARAERPRLEGPRRLLAVGGLIVGGLLCLLLWAAPARADYLPLSGAEVANNIAEIRIGNDGVRIQLEIFIGDARAFEDLIPDEWFSADVSARPREAERLAEFKETGLSLRRDDGTALPVRIDRIEPRIRIDRTTALTGQRDPITGRAFPKPPDDPRVIYAELFYDFEGRRPAVLTIAPPVDPDGTPRATIGFVTFDRGVPVANFAYLSAAAPLAIDWNDPWYSRFENPNLRRHHRSGVTTYLYVEPRELRHETLIRVRDIDPWLGLDLTPGRQLSPEAQAQIKSHGARLLAGRNPVFIDGEVVAPGSVRAELLTIDTAGLQVAEGEQDLSADEAFLGVILSFPWRDLPETVSVQWDMFNDRVSAVPATATDPAGPFLSGASPEDPEIVWRNHLLTYETPEVRPVPVGGAGRLRIPVLSVMGIGVAFAAAAVALRRRGGVRLAASGLALAGLAGAALTTGVATVDIPNPFARAPESAEAAAVVSALLDNINSANLEVTPEAREGALDPFVSAGSLPDIAAELDRALAIRVPGGGVARVTEVRDLALKDLAPVEGEFGFRALAEWTARASAGHWGHTHRRIVAYRALVEVIDDAGDWKLDGITVLEARMPDA